MITFEGDTRIACSRAGQDETANTYVIEVAIDFDHSLLQNREKRLGTAPVGPNRGLATILICSSPVYSPH